jgi:PAS domain S-box-containing protein
MPLPDHVLISRVAAALAGRDPVRSFTEALNTLAASGFVAHTPAAGEPWLEVEAGERSISLAAAAEPADPTLRETLRHLLCAGLERIVERDELIRVQERLEMLSAASFEGIFAHVDGVIVDANQRLAELLGYEPSELLGEQTMRRCVGPEDIPAVLERLRTRYEGAYMITGVRKDGSRFRAELQSKQGTLGDKPVRVVAVRDVSERERTHALLRESEERLRDLAEQAFDFITYSKSGVAVEVSGGVEQVLGFKPAECIGKKLVEFVAPSSLSLAEQVLAEQRPGAYELVLLGNTGQQVPVEIVGVMSSLGGEPVRVDGVRDLREQRRQMQERRVLEEQLQRSRHLESLGVLAGGVAHDFNNLLVGVLGNAELLQCALSQPGDRELCQAIITAAQRAASLTSQLLAYAGQPELIRRQALDLGVLWRELDPGARARLPDNVELDVQLGPESVVVGDHAGISQVLMNLLTNASESFRGAGGTIEVRTSRVREPDERWDNALGAPVGPGDWVQIEVRDTGIGIDPANLGRLCEPFFSTKNKGQGLGLASCLGIVSSHGGALSVQSEPGRGSRFFVLLPACARVAAPAPAPPASVGQPCKILVIDDESVVRSLLRRSLERRGYSVAEAGDGQAGIRAIREATPDLVVLDMTMPELDGAEVLRRIRADGFTMPILIASGHLDAAMESRLSGASFQGFLRKPFSVAELVTAIEAARVNPLQNDS